MNCILCHQPSHLFSSAAYKCSHCLLVFKSPEDFLSTDEDLKRYSTHQNNSEDLGYIAFLNRLVLPLKNFLPEQFSGLDFGCGPGPTLHKLLEDEKKSRFMFNFDPLFFNDQFLLEKTYDVVTSTEVVEHFKNPTQDWEQLIGLVKGNGLLAVMTQFLHEDVDYQSWWYKNDPTHVVFYNQETFHYLAKVYNLEILYCDLKSIIIFRKKSL